MVDGVVDAVQFGRVGRSLSGLINASKSYEIMHDMLMNEPSLVKCSNELCISCYGRFRYNGFGVARFYPQKLFHHLTKVFGAEK